MLNLIEEKQLTEGIKLKNDECFRYIYKKSYPFISDFVLKSGGSLDEVKDLLQDGLVILFENITLNIFEGKSEILTYFNSICKNKWINYLNRQKKRVILIDDFEKFIETTEDVNDNEETSETLNYIEALVATASERCKKIFIAYYYDNLSMTDIAMKLGYTNADNAKSQKAKCMNKLRNAVKTKKIESNDFVGKR